MKKRLDDLMKENAQLRTSFREENAKNVLKISVLESELQVTKNQVESAQIELNKVLGEREMDVERTAKLTRKNDKIEKELAKVSEEAASLTRELHELKQKELEFVNYVNTTKSKTAQGEQNCEMVTAENKKLKSLLKEKEEELKSAHEYNNRLESENNELVIKIDKQNNSYCTLPEHEDIKSLQKQNEVLKEIIKSLKKGKDNKDLEDKVARMEQLVSVIKNSLMSKDKFKGPIAEQLESLLPCK